MEFDYFKNGLSKYMEGIKWKEQEYKKIVHSIKLGYLATDIFNSDILKNRSLDAIIRKRNRMAILLKMKKDYIIENVLNEEEIERLKYVRKTRESIAIRRANGWSELEEKKLIQSHILGYSNDIIFNSKILKRTLKSICQKFTTTSLNKNNDYNVLSEEEKEKLEKSKNTHDIYVENVKLKSKNQLFSKDQEEIIKFIIANDGSINDLLSLKGDCFLDKDMNQIEYKFNRIKRINELEKIQENSI